MSEKTYTHHQHEKDKPNHELEDHSQEILDQLAEKAKDAKREHEDTNAEKLNELRNEANEEALKTDEVLAQHHESERPEPASSLVNRDLKDIKYKRTLQSVRKDLNPAEKALSKVMHNPVIDAMSEAAGKTIARPSGFLSGGFFAFVGSLSFLYIAKHYGYTYNFLLMTLFFVAGFTLGLLLEMLFRLIKKLSKT